MKDTLYDYKFGTPLENTIINGEVNPVLYLVVQDAFSKKFKDDTIHVLMHDPHKISVISEKYNTQIDVDIEGQVPSDCMSKEICRVSCDDKGLCYAIVYRHYMDLKECIFITEKFTDLRVDLAFSFSPNIEWLREENTFRDKVVNFFKIHKRFVRFLPLIFPICSWIIIIIRLLIGLHS